ncbi:hypothetical protein D3C81_1840340 [compost metagenome]
MAQEARIDTRITQRQGFTIDPYRAILQRADDVVGGIEQGVEVGAVIPAQALGGGNEHLQRCVTRPRAHAGEAGVDAVAAFLDGND